MSHVNRVFPAWRKTKKGERMPGSYPQKKTKALVNTKVEPPRVKWVERTDKS